MSTTPTPTNTTEEKPSFINRILPGISKKEKGGAAGPMGKTAPEISGASDQGNDRRVRLYVVKIGKNKNLLQARRMHGPEEELLTVGCKDAQAFKVKTYIEAEADADGRLYIVEEKRWLRFAK